MKSHLIFWSHLVYICISL